MTVPPDGLIFALGPGGEFDRIRRIAASLGADASGLGDDCAQIGEGEAALLTSTDLAVEDVHFRRLWLAPEEIGWRAAAAALSDLAADGARASGLLAAVAVPADTAPLALEGLMRGVGAAAAAAGATVLGGDLSHAPLWLVGITVFGRARHRITRRGALPGDGLWVTGALGGARAALTLWQDGQEPPADFRPAFAHPVPRLEAGEWLAAHGAHAMLDLSDGLVGDAGHLAAASGVLLHIQLERVPLAPGVNLEARRVGVPAPVFAALGGEDFELLVALPPEFDTAVAARFRRECGITLSRIGQVTEGSGVSFTFEEHLLDLSGGGYSHFP